MKKVWIILILVSLVIGVGGFFVFKEQKTDIIVFSYDWESSISLGEYNIETYSSSGDSSNFSDPLTTFSFKSESDESRFLEVSRSLEEYVSVVNYQTDNTFGYSYYMFLSQGYYYVLYKNVLDNYVLTPMYSYYTFIGNEGEETYRFSFPIYTSFNEDSGSQDNLAMSFADLIQYYGELSDLEVIIDEQNQIISLNAYIIFDLEKTVDLPINIVWQNDGYTIEFNEVE